MLILIRTLRRGRATAEFEHLDVLHKALARGRRLRLRQTPRITSRRGRPMRISSWWRLRVRAWHVAAATNWATSAATALPDERRWHTSRWYCTGTGGPDRRHGAGADRRRLSDLFGASAPTWRSPASTWPSLEVVLLPECHRADHLGDLQVHRLALPLRQTPPRRPTDAFPKVVTRAGHGPSTRWSPPSASVPARRGCAGTLALAGLFGCSARALAALLVHLSSPSSKPDAVRGYDVLVLQPS